MLADSPLACIRCARATLDWSNAFGRPMDCPRARRASRAATMRPVAFDVSMPTDLARLLDAVKDSRYFPALQLIATTGMRKGEALGLSWKAVDLAAGLLKVITTLGRVDGILRLSEPKTARSRRVIPLSAPIVTMLKAHRKDQLAERLAAGDQ